MVLYLYLHLHLYLYQGRQSHRSTAAAAAMSPPTLKKNTYFLRSGAPSISPTAKEAPNPTANPTPPRRHSVAPSIERWMQHVFASPVNTTPRQHQKRIHNPLDPRYLGNIPFSYTTDKLQQWGSVYLGNAATADAFVRALPLPLPQQQQQKRIVRVRVRGPRRAFYMQKSFPHVSAPLSQPQPQPYKRRLPVPIRMLCPLCPLCE